MESLNIAIIGCGRIGQVHARAVLATPHFHLAAFCDTDEAAARRLACESDSKAAWVGSDLQMMLQEVPLDAAIVGTPPNSHLEVVRHLLESGIHVLCEKPLALSTSAALVMSEAANLQKRHLLLASKLRFVDDVRKAKTMIEASDLGEIVSFEIAFCSPVAMCGRWNADPEIAGGGVLMDNGPHAVDLARFLFGPVQAIAAQLSHEEQKLPVEDTALVQSKMKNGVTGNIRLSWSAPPEDVFLSVQGTKNVLRVGWSDSRICNSNGLEPAQCWGSGYNKGAAFALQLAHFITTISGTSEPIITLEDSLASVRVVEAAYRAAHARQWVEVR